MVKQSKEFTDLLKRVEKIEAQLVELGQSNASAPKKRGGAASKGSANKITTYTAMLRHALANDHEKAIGEFSKSQNKGLAKDEGYKKTKEGSKARLDAEYKYYAAIAKSDKKIADAFRSMVQAYKETNAADEASDKQEESSGKGKKGKAGKKSKKDEDSDEDSNADDSDESSSSSSSSSDPDDKDDKDDKDGSSSSSDSDSDDSNDSDDSSSSSSSESEEPKKGKKGGKKGKK